MYHEQCTLYIVHNTHSQSFIKRKMCEKVNKITVTLKGANLLESAKYYTKLLSHITCLTGANYSGLRRITVRFSLLQQITNEEFR